MVIKMWKQEWRVEGFTLNYHTPEHFTRCHWQKAERVKPLWIVYRAFVVLYFTLSFLYTIIPIDREIPEENQEKYLIFLTHWTYLVEFFQFVLALIIVVLKAVAESKSSPPVPMEKMPWYYQVYWVFFTIALSSAIVVTLIFWTSVFDPELYPANPSNFIEHAFNSVFIIIDFWLIGFPLKFLHFYWPVLYGMLYMFFSIIYELSGGKGVKGMIPIYKILDWRYPGSAIVTCCFSFFFLLFLHFLFSCLSIFKLWVKKRKTTTTSANS